LDLYKSAPITFIKVTAISGKPIGEAIAWYALVVMNTQQELEIVVREYWNNAFVKKEKSLYGFRLLLSQSYHRLKFILATTRQMKTP
jgi:hypothetical protein